MSQMKKVSQSKSLEVSLGVSGVEVASSLLLKHLEHFLLTASTPINDFQRDQRRRLDSSLVITANVDLEIDSESISKLRTDVRKFCNDLFYDSLAEVDKVRKRNQKEAENSSFLDVAIRRLKRISSLYTTA